MKMCEWGTDTLIYAIRSHKIGQEIDGWHPVYVDSCISDYVQIMNDRGIITVNCCCGHFRIKPTVLVAKESEPLMIQYGYTFVSYFIEDYILHYIP